MFWNLLFQMSGRRILYDPVIHNPSEFIAFCERHEFAEGNVNTAEDKKGRSPKPVRRTVQTTEISSEILCGGIKHKQEKETN
jgi:hypothetical protein